MNGKCECGCGRIPAIAKRTDRRRGYVKGQPIRFILGHVARLNDHGKSLYRHAYGTKKREHVVIVEQALGHALPPGAEVHHANGNKKDNGRGNLVACQDHAYHFLLEVRGKALRASGHAAWRRCLFCRRYDDPSNVHTNSQNSYHHACRRACRPSQSKKT